MLTIGFPTPNHRIPTPPNQPTSISSNSAYIPFTQNLAADVRGVDFSRPIPHDVADEIIRGADNYGLSLHWNDNEQHIQFSKYIGDLDGIWGYLLPGVRMIC